MQLEYGKTDTPINMTIQSNQARAGLCAELHEIEKRQDRVPTILPGFVVSQSQDLAVAAQFHQSLAATYLICEVILSSWKLSK